MATVPYNGNNWQQLVQLQGLCLIWAIGHSNCELLAQMTTRMDWMEANVLASQTVSQRGPKGLYHQYLCISVA
jgi:hypothetical protein